MGVPIAERLCLVCFCLDFCGADCAGYFTGIRHAISSRLVRASVDSVVIFCANFGRNSVRRKRASKKSIIIESFLARSHILTYSRVPSFLNCNCVFRVRVVVGDIRLGLRTFRIRHIMTVFAGEAGEIAFRALTACQKA